MVVFAVITTRFTYTQRRIKFSVIIVCLVSVVFGGFATILNYNSVYSCYVPDLSIKENSNYIQEFFPYHNISDSSINGVVNYTADYFQSISPFMNIKFYLDKGIILPSDLIYVDAYTQQEKIEINGVKINLFTKDNSTDCGLFIRKGNKAIYAEVDNVYKAGVSNEDFAKEVINQFVFLEKTADDGTLLEIPEK